jgi:hypothetical protein
MITTVFLCCLCACVYAGVDQQEPSNSQTLPQPAIDTNEAEGEPPVSITKQAGQTVEEYRISGRLYMIKITSKIGAPYYLVDDEGDGKLSRQDGLDFGVRPARWVIFRF